MSVDRLPEVARLVVMDPVDIDQIGVAARLVADHAVLLVAGDVDGEGEAVADRLRASTGVPPRGRRLDEADLLVQAAGVRYR